MVQVRIREHAPVPPGALQCVGSCQVRSIRCRRSIESDATAKSALFWFDVGMIIVLELSRAMNHYSGHRRTSHAIIFSRSSLHAFFKRGFFAAHRVADNRCGMTVPACFSSSRRAWHESQRDTHRERQYVGRARHTARRGRLQQDVLSSTDLTRKSS